jgi:hypothetical protein
LGGLAVLAGLPSGLTDTVEQLTRALGGEADVCPTWRSSPSLS